MLQVQETNHGNMRGYIGAPPLDLLREKITLPWTLNYGQPQIQLDEDGKVVDAIATFVRERVSSNLPWFLGPVTVCLWYRQQEHEPKMRLLEGVEEGQAYGELEVDDSVAWIPIDGLHRLHGMFKALNTLTWEKEKLSQNPIPVIFLPLSDIDQLQELIVRMHKSARAVTRGEVIRSTATEDDYSVYASWLKGGDEPTHPGAIPEKLVNWKSNTITNRLRQFTSLSTLYDSSEILDRAFGGHTAQQMEKRYFQIHHIWKLLLEKFTLFREALSGDHARLPALRARFLCIRPTGQLIIINVMALALKERVSLNEVVQRMEAVPWEIDNEIWRDVIIVDGRVNGRTAATLLAAKLVAYLIGIPMSDKGVEELKWSYKKGKKPLPSRLFDEPLKQVNDQELFGAAQQ